MIRVLEIMPLAHSAMEFIGDQLSYFKEQGGYEMHLISTPADGIYEFAEREGTAYYPMVIPRTIEPLQDIKNMWRIFRYVRKHKIDVVIGHQSKGILYGMLPSKLGGAKYRVVLAHGVLEDTMTGLKQKIFATENKIMSSFATHVLCVSPSVMRRRVELGIDKPERQRILGKGTCNGVDALNKFNPQIVPASITESIRDKYGLKKDDFVVGFCGRLVRDKGVTELAGALKLLKERYPELPVKLFVIGDLEKRDALPDETVNFLKESKDVIFTGRVDYSEIQNYYTVMDAFVLPSYREGFPTVVLEASAMALPLIVSRSTGCIDSIIENQTGVYCDITPESIAEAVMTFADREKAYRFGQAGRQFVLENFEHTKVKALMLDLLNDITSKRD